VLTYGMRTGTFSSVNLPNPGGGLHFEVVYGDTSVDIEATPAGGGCTPAVRRRTG
jgi:hypothetical protein